MDLYAYVLVEDGKISGLAMMKALGGGKPFPCIAGDREEAGRMVRMVCSTRGPSAEGQLFHFSSGEPVDEEQFLD